MVITDRIKHLTKKPSALHEDDDDLLLSKEVFRKIIDRERDRANRTGEIFSLVVYQLSDKKERQEDVVRLAEALTLSIRSIDAVGWLDSQHVGVLLPETDSVGAQKFVDKIDHQTESLRLLSNYEIFTYPSLEFTEPGETTRPGSNVQVSRRAAGWSGWHFAHSHRKVDYIFCLTKKILKRGFDIGGSIIFLLILSPLFLAVTLLIKAVSPGPVFFKQQRIGYGGHPFTFLKFRTMRSGADSTEHQEYLASLIHGESSENNIDAPMIKLDHDPQIIPLGNMLRKSCLDELPQLINVLRGDMSLVGPRPPIPYEVKEYHPWHRGRFNALPGMTGLWQVSGKNKLSFREMVRLDIRYAKERTLWLDIKILFKTPLAILDQLKGGMSGNNSTIGEGA